MPIVAYLDNDTDPEASWRIGGIAGFTERRIPHNAVKFSTRKIST